MRGLLISTAMCLASYGAMASTASANSCTAAGDNISIAIHDAIRTSLVKLNGGLERRSYPVLLNMKLSDISQSLSNAARAERFLISVLTELNIDQTVHRRFEKPRAAMVDGCGGAKTPMDCARAIALNTVRISGIETCLAFKPDVTAKSPAATQKSGGAS